MNAVMAAMAAVSVPWKGRLAAATSPLSPEFWFVMSIALCAGFLVAYPVNWWLVAWGLKHGMKTIYPDDMASPLAQGQGPVGSAQVNDTPHPSHSGEAVDDASMGQSYGKGGEATDPRSHAMQEDAMPLLHHPQSSPSRLQLVALAGVSLAILAAGVAIAALAASLFGT